MQDSALPTHPVSTPVSAIADRLLPDSCTQAHGSALSYLDGRPEQKWELLMGHLQALRLKQSSFHYFLGQKEAGSVLNIITVHGANKWHFCPVCRGPAGHLIPLCLYPWSLSRWSLWFSNYRSSLFTLEAFSHGRLSLLLVFPGPASPPASPLSSSPHPAVTFLCLPTLNGLEATSGVLVISPYLKLQELTSDLVVPAHGGGGLGGRRDILRILLFYS